MMHIRFDGRSIDLGDRDIAITAAMTDAEIKQRVAGHLDIGLDRMAAYVIDRGPKGDIVIRPEAVYG